MSEARADDADTNTIDEMQELTNRKREEELLANELEIALNNALVECVKSLRDKTNLFAGARVKHISGYSTAAYATLIVPNILSGKNIVINIDIRADDKE